MEKAPPDERPAVLDMQSDGGAGGMGDVVGFALLPDSSMLVGDADDAQLVRIASNGALVARVGKRGASIGEFSRLQWVGPCGNITAVHDIALSRLSLYNESFGAPVTKTIPKAFDSRDVAGCLGDGRVIILNDSFPRPGQWCNATTAGNCRVRYAHRSRGHTAQVQRHRFQLHQTPRYQHCSSVGRAHACRTNRQRPARSGERS